MKQTKILVVEDESIVARDIRNMLIGLNYHVVDVVSSAQAAIKTSEKENPDIVLMDIMLHGGMSGVDAANVIYREMNIPIIYLTAYADEKTLLKAKETAPFGYLLKPFEERELQSSIEIALYKFQMEKKLKESERWLSTILRSIADGVIATNQQAAVSYMNPMAEKLTGWTQNEALNKTFDKIFKLKPPPEAVKESSSLPGALDGTGILNQGILISRKGDETQIEYRIAPIVEENNKVVGSAVAITDITWRKKAEDELRDSWNKLKNAMDGTVQAMAFTIEQRDPYTAGHQRRVTKLALAIAVRLNFEKDRMDGLRMAGELHDIGKIYVPAEILSKPGKITEVEYNIIKTHPKVGYDILKTIEFPWPVHEFVLQHHERLDGSGYPEGLKEEAIHTEAKILAVADVIEAMSTHRPYRPALSLDSAINEIKKNRGTLYDPQIVDACIEALHSKDFSFE